MQPKFFSCLQENSRAVVTQHVLNFLLPKIIKVLLTFPSFNNADAQDEHSKVKKHGPEILRTQEKN